MANYSTTVFAPLSTVQHHSLTSLYGFCMDTRIATALQGTPVSSALKHSTLNNLHLSTQNTQVRYVIDTSSTGDNDKAGGDWSKHLRQRTSITHTDCQHSFSLYSSIAVQYTEHIPYSDKYNAIGMSIIVRTHEPGTAPLSYIKPTFLKT